MPFQSKSSCSSFPLPLATAIFRIIYVITFILVKGDASLQFAWAVLHYSAKRLLAGTVRWNVEIGAKVFVGGNHQRRTEEHVNYSSSLSAICSISRYGRWRENLPLTAMLALPCVSQSVRAREIAPRQIHELGGKEVRTLLPLHIDI